LNILPGGYFKADHEKFYHRIKTYRFTTFFGHIFSWSMKINKIPACPSFSQWEEVCAKIMTGADWS
jgi:hypothetical protein